MIPINMRHRLVNDGDEEAFIVFHLGPLAPAPAPRSRRHGVVRRATDVVTGVGVVAPGGPTRDSFWECITAGRTATRRIIVLRPIRVPLADRRGGRLRPVRGRAHRARGSPHGPLHPVRGGRHDGGDRRQRLDLEEVDRDRMGGEPRLGGRRDHGPEDGYVAVSEPRPGVARRPRVRAAVPLPGPRAQQPGQRDRAQGRRRTARPWSSPPAAPPGSTRSATATR